MLLYPHFDADEIPDHFPTFSKPCRQISQTNINKQNPTFFLPKRNYHASCAVCKSQNSWFFSKQNLTALLQRFCDFVTHFQFFLLVLSANIIKVQRMQFYMASCAIHLIHVWCFRSIVCVEHVITHVPVTHVLHLHVHTCNTCVAYLTLSSWIWVSKRK